MNSIVVIGAMTIASLEEIKRDFQEMGVVVKQATNPLYVSFDSIGFPERVLEIVKDFGSKYPEVRAEILYMDIPQGVVTYRKFYEGNWEIFQSDDRRVCITGVEYCGKRMSPEEVAKLEEERKVIRVSLKHLEKMFNLKMLDPDLVKIKIYENPFR